jgi:hypothetical protein
LALILALLLQLVQAPPRDTAPQRDRAAPPGNASVSGRVYSAATGGAVRGALVVLAPVSTPFEGSSFRVPVDFAKSGASTDATGRFQVTSAVPGVYYVVAIPSSYAGRYLAAGFGAVRGNDPGKPITIAGGADVRGIDIALPSTLAIEGRVFDEGGDPLSRIPVFAARLLPGSDSAERVSSVAGLTDDLGRYRLYGLEAGTYLVFSEGRAGVMFFEPLAGRGMSSLTIQQEREPFVLTLHPSALTEAEGQRVRLSGQDVTGIDITLRRARRLQLSGTLLDSQGTPASTNAMLVRKGALGVLPERSFHSNEQGRFSVSGIEPGEYRLIAGPGMGSGLAYINGRTEFVEMPLTMATDIPDMVVVTQPGIGLAGQVVFSEGPPASPPKIRIAFRRAETTPASREIVATSDDEFRFYGSDLFGSQLVRVTELPAGWVLKAVTLAGADITDVPTVFKEADNGQLQVVLSSKASTLEGTVRGEGSSAAGDATVYVFSEDRSGWRMSSPRTHKSAAGANGKFSVGGLAAGRYYAIAVAREGFRPAANPGESFFELLSKDATAFVIGDDDRRTVELPLWRWPE